VQDVTEPNITKLLYTRTEVSSMLSLSPRSVDYLIAAGNLKVIRIGRSVRITLASLNEFVERDRPTESRVTMP
jgi:excisionase family DNA binding protein